MVTMNHDYSKEQMISLAIVFMVLPTIFYLLRLWAKTLIAKRLSVDDYLAGVALLVSITCCALQLATAVHGHLGQHQPQFPNGDPIMDDPGLIFFEKTKFAINCISILGLGFVKLSILVLYKNIFKTRKFQYALWVVIAFVSGWTISYFFSHVFTCVPMTVFIEPYYGNKCVKTVPMFLSLLYTDVFADVTILLLPIPMVWSVQMPRQKKIAVAGILMLGAAVCAISITRVIATYAIAEEYIHHPNDVIYYTAPVFFWTNIELSLAIVCSCLPTLRPIVLHFFPAPLKSHSASYGYSSSRQTGTKKSGMGSRYGHGTYNELDELELTRIGPTRSDSPPGEGEIIKEVTVYQTVQVGEDSSQKSLRGGDKAT